MGIIKQPPRRRRASAGRRAREDLSERGNRGGSTTDEFPRSPPYLIATLNGGAHGEKGCGERGNGKGVRQPYLIFIFTPISSNSKHLPCTSSKFTLS